MNERLPLLGSLLVVACGQPFWTPAPAPPPPRILTAADPRQQLVGAWRVEFVVDSALIHVATGRREAVAASGEWIAGTLEVQDSLDGRPPYQTQRVVLQVAGKDAGTDLSCITDGKPSGPWAGAGAHVALGLFVTVRKRGTRFSLVAGNRYCGFNAEGRFGADTATGSWHKGDLFHGADGTFGRFRMVRLHSG